MYVYANPSTHPPTHRLGPRARLQLHQTDPAGAAGGDARVRAERRDEGAGGAGGLEDLGGKWGVGVGSWPDDSEWEWDGRPRPNPAVPPKCL